MSAMLQPGTGSMWWVAMHGSDPSTSHPNAGVVPPMETPEKKELLILVEMGRWVLVTGTMGNKQSNLSRLPGAKTLMHGSVLILNP